MAFCDICLWQTTLSRDGWEGLRREVDERKERERERERGGGGREKDRNR